MRELSKYHSRDMHEWEDGKCDFHSLMICSCGNCEQDTLTCEGKEYHTSHVLTCPLHSLAYEIECNHRAEHAEEIIDPELGKGHSNACEATFSVFPKFRPKDVGLQKLLYQASTNLALIQASMTYLFKKRGAQYHWMPDLFQRMGLPLLDGMIECVSSQQNLLRITLFIESFSAQLIIKQESRNWKNRSVIHPKKLALSIRSNVR